MKEFELPTEDRKDNARRRFAESQFVDELMASDASDSIEPKRIPISRLYGVASTMGDRMPVDIAAAMLHQPRLRAVYRDLLARVASYYVPAAMAASTDTLPVRDGDGCRIRFEESQAEPDQVYVIVELIDFSRPPPTAIVFCDADDFCTRFELPDWRSNIAQWIVDTDSDILRLARDPKSVAYFR